MQGPLKPFFTYFGGKHRIAKDYPRPRFNTVIESFAGSAGYATRYHRSYVLLYDLDPIIFGTWNYLIRVSSREVLSLPLVFDDVRDLKICQEAKWLIGWWLNKGTSKPRNIPGSWMRGRTNVNSFWGAVIRGRIAKQLQFIRHWKVVNKSYEEIENQQACWFIDPPYQRSGTHYSHNQIDYDFLGDWARSRRGQVIACGQEGDDWVDFRLFLSTRTSPNIHRKDKRSKEVIWCQG